MCFVRPSVRIESGGKTKYVPAHIRGRNSGTHFGRETQLLELSHVIEVAIATASSSRSCPMKVGPPRRVSHAPRPEVSGPVHVTLKLRRCLPSMRTPRTYRVLERAFRQALGRNGLSVCAYSILSNHIHMFVEVDNKRGLSRGMQGLQIRIAKALNKLWRRKGSIFADRYHASIPKGIRQIRRMMRYVLLNARKHGIPIPEGQPDRYSSGPFYPFWREYDQGASAAAKSTGRLAAVDSDHVPRILARVSLRAPGTARARGSVLRRPKRPSSGRYVDRRGRSSSPPWQWIGSPPPTRVSGAPRSPANDPVTRA